MNRAAIIISLFAISIISMDLALSIVLNNKRHLSWTRWFIVFLASLLGLSILFNLDVISSFLWKGRVASILKIVWESIFILDSSFLCVFSLFFCYWLIANPMPIVVKILSSLLGGIYLVLSVLNQFLSSRLLYTFRYICACLILFSIVTIMLIYYRKIESRRVKIVCLTLIIISFSMIPLMVLAIVLPSTGLFALSLLGLSFFIAFLVFLFIAVTKKEEMKVDKNEYLIEKAKKYGITSRELEVIKLIKNGDTNKEIASSLSISVNTVNNHIANIFSKTGTRSRIDLLNLFEEAAW